VSLLLYPKWWRKSYWLDKAIDQTKQNVYESRDSNNSLCWGSNALCLLHERYCW